MIFVHGWFGVASQATKQATTTTKTKKLTFLRKLLPVRLIFHLVFQSQVLVFNTMI